MGSTSALARRHLDLLRRAPSFRLLFLATVGSGIGTMLAVIALMVDVFDRTGSGTWVAALLIADFLPMLAVGLALGPLVDRFSRRTVMIVSDLVRCAVFVALPFAPGPHAIVALAAVVGLAAGLFRPAVYAGLPRLVSQRDLPHANALFGGFESATWMIGPLLGGLLLSVAGPSLPYVVNAVTFLVSAALLARIPAHLLAAPMTASEGHWRDLAAGFRTVRASRALLTVLVAWSVVAMGSGAVNVAEVAIAKVAFAAGDFGLGLLMATAGLGLTLGSLSAGAWVERRPVAHVYGGAIAVMAVAIFAAALAPTIWVAAVLVVLFGFGNGVASVCNPLFVQRGASDHVRGRVFTLVMSANMGALGLGMGLAGPATDAFGARWVWAGAALAFLVGSVLAVILARGAAIDARAEAPGTDGVTPLPAGVPHAAGEPLQ